MSHSRSAQNIQFVQWAVGGVTLCVEGDEEHLTLAQFEAKLAMARRLFSIDAGDYWVDKTDEFIYRMIQRAGAVFGAAHALDAAHEAFDRMIIGVPLRGEQAMLEHKS